MSGPNLVHVNANEFVENYIYMSNIFKDHFGIGAKLSPEQLSQIFQTLQATLPEGNAFSDGDLKKLLAKIDIDNTGEIDIEEFLYYICGIEDIEKAATEDFKGLTKAAVFCRIRPIGGDGDGHGMGEEDGDKKLDGWQEDPPRIWVKDRDERIEFKYPKEVLGPGVSQEDAYNSIMKDIVSGWIDNCMNVMLLAYGQTGTGKTHTMFGPRASLNSPELHPDWGLFPRAVHKCLADYGQYLSGSMDDMFVGAYSLRASATEFYLGEAFDLIGGKRKLEFTPEGCALGSNFVEITKVSDLGPFLDEVAANRTMSATKMNEGSSRSHCALTLTLSDMGVWTKEVGKKLWLSRQLTLIDMAGSERPGKTGAERIGPFQIPELMRKTDNGKKMTKAQRNGLEGGMINFELTNLKSEIEKAAVENLTTRKYKNNTFWGFPMFKLVGRCLIGEIWMNTVICLSQSPQNGFETWFSCRWGEGIAKLQAPLKKVKLQDAEVVKKKMIKAAADAKKVFDDTPKTGAPSSKYWATRKANAKQTADALELLEMLEKQVDAKIESKP